MTDTQKKLLMYGVPIVAVLGLVVLLRSRSSSPSGTVSGSTTAGDTAVGLGQLADFQNAYGQQLARIQSEITALQGSTTATGLPAPSSPTPSGNLVGSGYFTGAGATAAPSGGNYDYLASMAQVTALQGTGGTVYFEPVPGVFQPVASLSALAPGTPLYASAG